MVIYHMNLNDLTFHSNNVHGESQLNVYNIVRMHGWKNIALYVQKKKLLYCTETIWNC